MTKTPRKVILSGVRYRYFSFVALVVGPGIGSAGRTAAAHVLRLTQRIVAARRG